MNSIVKSLREQAFDILQKQPISKLANLMEHAALEIESKAAENARLTAAHAMQGEELVTLPRNMVYSMEDKLKEQAAYIEWANAKIEALERVK